MEPWFNPNLHGWIFGTVLGVVGGCFGGLAGTLAHQGRCRGLVMGMMSVILLYSILLLIAGLVAWFGGQPYGVWYALLLPGLIGTLIFSLSLPRLMREYAQAELRKMKAQDF